MPAPAPSAALLPWKKSLINVVFPGPCIQSPPPNPVPLLPAVLLVIIDSLTLSAPALLIPAPMVVAVLPVMVEPLTYTLAPAPTSKPPPPIVVLVLSEIVESIVLKVAPGKTWIPLPELFLTWQVWIVAEPLVTLMPPRIALLTARP